MILGIHEVAQLFERPLVVVHFLSFLASAMSVFVD
jgi:hypothetical protein